MLRQVELRRAHANPNLQSTCQTLGTSCIYRHEVVSLLASVSFGGTDGPCLSQLRSLRACQGTKLMAALGSLSLNSLILAA